MQKLTLSIAVTGLALCTVAGAGVVTLMDTVVNDGSFEQSYSTVDGTGYLKFNNDTTIWDLSNANTSTRGIMESSNAALWSDRTGSLNPDTARGTGAYIDSGQSTALYVYNRGVEAVYGSTEGTITALEGDVLNWSFDFNSGANDAASVLDVRIHAAGTAATSYTADFTGWSAETGSYTLTAADADAVNAGDFQFGIKMSSGGSSSPIRADNFNLSVTQAVPEPATLGLLGLAFGGLVMLRRRKK